METKLELDTSAIRAGFLRVAENVGQRLGGALESVADFVLGEAKDRAPIDTGALTENLRCASGKDDKVFYVSVYVPINAPAAPYAIQTHEGIYSLGEGSRAKQAKVAVTVGPGYISRAFSENLGRIGEIIAGELR